MMTRITTRTSRAELVMQSLFSTRRLLARREAKARVRQRDRLKRKNRPEQVGNVPIFFSIRVDKFATWKNRLNSLFRKIFFALAVNIAMNF